MTRIFRAHYDGSRIVPDEPLDLPLNRPLQIDCRPADDEWSPEQLEAQAAAADHLLCKQATAGELSTEALRREHLYEERA